MCVLEAQLQPFLHSPGLHHSLLLLWGAATLKGAAKSVCVELELHSKELFCVRCGCFPGWGPGPELGLAGRRGCGSANTHPAEEKPCLSHALLTLGISGCGVNLQPCTAAACVLGKWETLGKCRDAPRGGSRHRRGLQVGVRAQRELLSEQDKALERCPCPCSSWTGDRAAPASRAAALLPAQGCRRSCNSINELKMLGSAFAIPNNTIMKEN